MSVKLRRRILQQIGLIGSLSGAWAASGTIEVRVRDAVTHYGVQAIVKLDGPETISFSTDARGKFKRELPPGEYTEEYSAPGYRSLRSHDIVEGGKITQMGAYLDPDSPPEEERPEILASKIRPGYMLLHDYVVDRETGEPISGVKVRFVTARIKTETDDRGHFWLWLLAPPPKPSGAPGGTDTLVYEKPGYKTLIFRNVGITDEEKGSALDLDKGNGTIEVDDTHKLMRNGSRRDLRWKLFDLPRVPAGAYRGTADRRLLASVARCFLKPSADAPPRFPQ